MPPRQASQSSNARHQIPNGPAIGKPRRPLTYQTSALLYDLPIAVGVTLKYLGAATSKYFPIRPRIGLLASMSRKAHPRETQPPVKQASVLPAAFNVTTVCELKAA